MANHSMYKIVIITSISKIRRRKTVTLLTTLVEHTRFLLKVCY